MDRNSLCSKLVNEILIKDEMAVEAPQLFFSLSNISFVAFGL